MIKILKLKHWQLFSLIVFFPIVGSFLFVFLITSYPGKTEEYLKIVFIADCVSALIFISWLFNLGIQLRKLLPAAVNLKLGLFRISIFIVCSFLIYVLLWELNLNSSYEFQNTTILYLLYPLSLLGLFYTNYIVSIEIKSVETKRKCSFKESILEFILICVFPVGVWIIQPRINKIFNDR